jgi:hypothetical protein
VENRKIKAEKGNQMKPSQVPCDECIKKGETIKNALLVCYCEHNQALGLYYVESQKWHLFSPMSKLEFYFYLKKSVDQADISFNKILDEVFEQMPGKEI